MWVVLISQLIYITIYIYIHRARDVNMSTRQVLGVSGTTHLALARALALCTKIQKLETGPIPVTSVESVATMGRHQKL